MVSSAASAIEIRPVEGSSRLVRTWVPSGQPWGSVLIVHGVAEHSGRYERTGGLLADAGLSVRSFDLEGHGGSGGNRGAVASWDVFLDAVEQESAEFRRGDVPLVLLGHSMGAAIALSYALSDRPQPEALVLSAPPVTGHGLAAWKETVAGLLGGVIPGLTIPNDIRGDQLSRDPAVGAAYFADPLALTKTTIGLGKAGFGAVRANAGSLDRLRVPTLVIHGGADTVVPPEKSLVLDGRPGVERHLYPKLRHELLNEPEGPEVVADIVGWIRRTVA